MTVRLDDKIILVTGAASGIGAAVAALIAARGGIAVATDLAGTPHRLDVTEPGDWDRMIAWTVAEHGRLDGLVSNAGIADFGPIVDFRLDRFRQLARVHVDGAFLGIQKAVAQFRAQGSPAEGSIVATSSVMGTAASPGAGGYCAVKAGLSNMARAIAVELGRKGDFIRVNVVAPGPVRTPMLAGAMGEAALDDPDSWRDVPLREASEPEDIAETMVFLLSDEARFMTGAVATVDGGWILT